MENTETIIDSPTEQTNDLNLWDAPSQTQETVNTEVAEVKTVVEPEVKVESTIVKDEPVVQEKIVEKIVEKYPEFKDDYSKSLYQSLLDGKDSDVYEYLQKKNKDYNTMSDVDVVKEKLKLDNPTWTAKDIDVEMKYKFGDIPAKKDLSGIDQTLDPDEYDKAVQFNDSVDQKELLLTREARDGRIALEGTKKNIEFPKIAQPEKEEAKQITQEEIDELNRKWDAHVEQEIPKLSDFKFKVGDEEVSYKISDEDKATQTAYMKGFNPEALVKDLGWIDENGNENVLKIAEDVLKLKNIEKIIASAVTQSRVSATKKIVDDIKNVDLNPRSPSSPETGASLGEVLWR